MCSIRNFQMISQLFLACTSKGVSELEHISHLPTKFPFELVHRLTIKGGTGDLKAICFIPSFSAIMIHTGAIICILLLVPLPGTSGSSIVGGKVSKPHSKPYMASLQYQEKHSCGGILIRKDFVLTAAHCKAQGDMTVVLGAHDLRKKEKSQQRIKVAKFCPHSSFSGKFDFDIMLLKLQNNATKNKYVKPLDLPKKAKSVSDKLNCLVAGWGKTGPNEPDSKVLKEGTERTLPNTDCEKIWGDHFKSQQMICTTFNKKDGGICQGDSGGPLICKKKLQGITAFTASGQCDNTLYPHVFTNINYFLPWIKEMMQTKSLC
ncbi:granzyme B-like isoform X3 [Xiphophorus couchianus]|uniref:granzyme B-like isoform X3 n=1 Tax=Xiphophorus couchianus TaxID=32473 RepID=UPI001016C0AE|nr:granzyme B-like isoform X3 [Xiphophorus couchianus]